MKANLFMIARFNIEGIILQLNMERSLILTTDGSHSIRIPAMDVTYHSAHGAIQESLHVFIKAGLRCFNETYKQPASLSIFEMGFGTGLNALLALSEAAGKQQHIYYETIEPYPLERGISEQLNYCEQLQRPDLETAFTMLHQCEWNTVVPVTH
jgi:tRNA U34 5-methylaminomethyl-2-thiouridine-forming methyltransferase MnmC